jgi:hypothetical protein
VLSSRHLENGIVAEERHYFHYVVVVEGVKERLERVLCDSRFRVHVFDPLLNPRMGCVAYSGEACPHQDHLAAVP